MSRPIPAFAPGDIHGPLLWALDQFGAGLHVACSLSAEDCLIVHLLAELAARRAVVPTVFVLDTGRLHEETYATLERLRARYDLSFRVYAPQAPAIEQLITLKGPLSFRASVAARQECCAIRKVEPLARALGGATAWVTGLRRAHSQGRATVEVIEADDGHGRVKINPLAHVDDAGLWALVARHDSIVHPLHPQGFPSIGCAPCTRAIAAGESPRAGRWWWEDPQHSECGLHVRHGSTGAEPRVPAGPPSPGPRQPSARLG